MRERGVPAPSPSAATTGRAATRCATRWSRASPTAGVDVVDIGVVPTPLLYWSLHNLDVVGGIQITGSHNPPEYNGFKLCLGTESLHGHDIQELFALIHATPRRRRAGSVRDGGRHRPLRATTSCARIGPDLRGRSSVVYDCGNGAAALVAPQLLRALGLDAIGLFTESDGTFPNHHPDPDGPREPRGPHRRGAARRRRARHRVRRRRGPHRHGGWHAAGSSGATICSSSTRATCSRARARASRSSST